MGLLHISSRRPCRQARPVHSPAVQPGEGVRSRGARRARRRYRTILRATAGVRLAVVLRPIWMILTPKSAPTRLLKLFSSAGPKPIDQDDPLALEKGLAPAALPAAVMPPDTLPLTAVLALRWYTTSNASTQLRVRLYSAAASAVNPLPGQARPAKPRPVP